jgi:hypothetical protein
MVLITTFLVSGLYDFFLHTQNFPKYRWIERVLITPSLHKVHHGKNDVYIDKNYGSTFVIWDRMFGTFQDETEPVEYGILSKSYRDGDPVDAIFHHFRYLGELMRGTPSWKEKALVLLMPPDWLPANAQPVDAMPELAEAPDDRSMGYGITLFILSSVGIVAVLVFREACTLVPFIAYTAFLLTGMIAGTRLYNRRNGLYYRRNELFRNMLFCTLFVALFYYLKSHPVHLLASAGVPLLFAGWTLVLPGAQKRVRHNGPDAIS